MLILQAPQRMCWTYYAGNNPQVVTNHNAVTVTYMRDAGTAGTTSFLWMNL